MSASAFGTEDSFGKLERPDTGGEKSGKAAGSVGY